MKIIVFGIGDVCEFLYKNHFYDECDVIAFTGSSVPQNSQIELNGKFVPIITLEEIQEYEVDHIVVAYNESDMIINTLRSFYCCPEKIISYTSFINMVCVSKLAKHQIKANDPEIDECMENVKKRGIRVFNYSFAENYIDGSDIECRFDSSAGLYYVMFNGKRMYMKRSFDSEKKIKEYVLGINLEQDPQSPHCYFNKAYNLSADSIVIDAGVAEGNFALSVIDKVSKIYLVECDEEWCEALEYTFKDYKDKVVIVKKFLSDKTQYDNICIDDICNDEKVDFIKLDIEGAEISALIGAEKTIERSENITIAACSYHHHNDEIIIKSLLEYYGLSAEASDGYMLFIWEENNNFYLNPEFRRGLVWGSRKSLTKVIKDKCSDDQKSNDSNDLKITADEFLDKIQELLNLNQIEKSWVFFQENLSEVKYNTQIEILRNIYIIYDLEKQTGCSSIFDYSTSIDELISYFTKLKFLLRRYEFDFAEENDLSEFIKKHNTSYVAVISVVNSSVVNRTDVLNKVSVEFFNNSMADYALKILLSSYEINPDNDVTLYSISFILNYIGAYSEAMSFANKINERSEEVETLKANIKEGLLNNGK